MPSRFALELRSASGADAQGLAKLMLAAGLRPALPGLANRIDAVRAEHGAVLMAVEWGPPSGVIALRWSWSLQESARSADVSLLLVDADARRRGVGRLLVKAGARAARSAGCDELRLAMEQEATGLRAFALATGFTGDGAVLSRPLKRG